MAARHNENTNRVLRHWFTKGTDLSVHTQADVRRIQNLLNSDPDRPWIYRPRPNASPSSSSNQPDVALGT